MQCAIYDSLSNFVQSIPQRYERSQFFAKDTRVNPAVDGRTFGGGYDRGHMVPNAVIGNQYGALAQMETFYMTNMCAQKEELNRGAWALAWSSIVDTPFCRTRIFSAAESRKPNREIDAGLIIYPG